MDIDEDIVEMSEMVQFHLNAGSKSMQYKTKKENNQLHPIS